MISSDRLKKFKIFHDAPTALLEKLSSVMTEALFNPSDVICKEGDAGGALYLIESGQVAVEKKAFAADGSSTSKIVARLETGEFFGEMAFLQGMPHSATVTAQEKTTILLLSRLALDDLAKKDPASALEQVLTVAIGLSNRLRATTRELVTVFEVARAVGASSSVAALAHQTVGQLQLDLGSDASVAFYRWNMFNDEYSLLTAEGSAKDRFPTVLDGDVHTLPFKDGFVASRIDMLNQRQGMFIYFTNAAGNFDAGERQMMETVSAVLAPALASAAHREEEEARQLLVRNKQMGSSY